MIATPLEVEVVVLLDLQFSYRISVLFLICVSPFDARWVEDLGPRLEKEDLSFIYIGRSVYVCLHISECEERRRPQNLSNDIP